MDHRGVELPDVVEQPVPDLLRDAVPFADGRVAVHHDRHRRLEGVTHPAQPDLGDVLDGRDRPGRPFEFVDELGLDRVHQAAQHLGRRLLEHDEDRDRDEEADERIRERVAQGDADGPAHDGEGRQAVRPGVVAVGDQGC